MTREAVEGIAKQIERAIDADDRPKCRVDIVGGYRRGKEWNNDVDILISPVEEVSIEGILRHVIGRLKAEGKVVEIMHYSEAKTGSKKSTATTDHLETCLCVYHCDANDSFQHVDIVVSPKSLLPFALLGWTG